ncbi:MAG: HNH endonuclease, partial [Candidatus Eisenbacteria sp.]|nr:HNH endonuclease [Candidatus Eisenbacteria bacterium]
TNDPENLIVLCSACHKLWHDKKSIPPVNWWHDEPPIGGPITACLSSQ